MWTFGDTFKLHEADEQKFGDGVVKYKRGFDLNITDTDIAHQNDRDYRFVASQETQQDQWIDVTNGKSYTLSGGRQVNN